MSVVGGVTFEPLPDVATAAGRARGRITFAASAPPAPPILLVTATGLITPAMVRADLAVARRFAEEQGGRPWWYVVDPTEALPHPANVRHLHAVRRLPGVAGYFVVARRQPIRAVSRVLVRLGGPHAVFRTLDAALDEISRRRHPPPPATPRTAPPAPDR